jgi:hypothetical protein
MIETVVRGLTVTLCPAELEWTRRVGERMAKRGQGLKPRYAAEYPGRFRETHIVGARSELTCAWVTGKLWLGRDTWKGADIEGTNWQVRWSKRAWKANQLDVDAGHIVVAVKGEAPTFTLVGWVFPRRVLTDRALRHTDKDTGEYYWLFDATDIPRHGRLGKPPADYVTEDR